MAALRLLGCDSAIQCRLSCWGKVSQTTRRCQAGSVVGLAIQQHCDWEEAVEKQQHDKHKHTFSTHCSLAMTSSRYRTNDDTKSSTRSTKT